MSLQTLFQKIECLPEVTLVQGDYIPMPETPLRTYLFINCGYRPRPANEQATELLAKLRADAIAALEMVFNSPPDEEFDSVCLSFFFIAQEGDNLRIYRTAIARDKLAEVATKGLAVCDGEESHHPELKKLL
jgi:hypothetical protein